MTVIINEFLLNLNYNRGWLKMRKISVLILAFLFILSAVSFATITSITGVTLTPPSPGNGASVQVSFSYTTTQNNDNPTGLILISDTTTVRNAGTAGQWLMIQGTGCNTPADPATAVTATGCQMGTNVMAGTYAAGPYTFTLPADLLPGVPYYILVVMGTYWCNLNGAPGNVESTGVLAVPFTLPLPPTSASITKTAESAVVQPGDLVLFTINYDYVNATNFRITDDVPAECTFVSCSAGGTLAGTTITWNTASTPGPVKRGSKWFTARVNAGTPPNTTIHNIAHWAVDEPVPGGDSNDATVVTGPLFNILKSQSTAAAAIGDTITYTFDFNDGGMAFQSFGTFDDNITTGFHSTAGVWGWAHVSTGTNEGYLFSPAHGATNYPHYLSDLPSDFCYGEVQGDVYIESNNDMDGLITFRDNGLAGAAGRAYGFGISADGLPHNMYIQEVNPTYAERAWANPFSVQANRWYTLKINVTDAGSGRVRIQGKAWLRGTAEPGWQIDWTDLDGSVPACGYVGFQGHATNYNYYDNLKIFSASSLNPRIYDTLPAQLTYVGGTAADTTHSAPVNSGGMVTWDIFTSLINNIYQLQLWATVNDCGILYNRASFDTDGALPQTDSNTTTLNVAICPQTPTSTPTYTNSPTATSTFTATPSATGTFTATPTATMTNTPIIPRFTISKAVAPGTAGRGETVTYTIHYANPSPPGLIALSSFEVWDTLPTEIENISNITGGLGTYFPATGVIHWLVGAVPLNGSGDLSFTATLKNTVTRDQVITNRAYGKDVMAPAVESNAANVVADVPVFELTPVTNYPNPFDGATTIVFDLTLLADNCSIKFYTISGELVKTMEFAEMISPDGGKLQTTKRASGVWAYRVYWDGKNNADNDLSSGVYLYRIKASAGTEEKKAMGRLAILR